MLGTTRTTTNRGWLLGIGLATLFTVTVLPYPQAQQQSQAFDTKTSELMHAVQRRMLSIGVMIEDYSDIITPNDLGFNDRDGNMGVLNTDDRVGSTQLVCSSPAPCYLRFAWDFTQTSQAFAFTGLFYSLGGLTSVTSTTDGQTVRTIDLPEYVLDLTNMDAPLIEPKGPRALGAVQVTLGTADIPVTLRMELKDSQGGGRFSRFPLPGGGQPVTLIWNFRDPAQYRILGTRDLDLTKGKVVSLVVERRHDADSVSNPEQGVLSIRSVSLQMAGSADFEPLSDNDLKERVERTAARYFLASSSRKPESFGMPQDRSTFPDLLSVGGVGFGIGALIIAADRGWITRQEARARTLGILRCLDTPGLAVRGWFPHFLSLECQRKKNFDWQTTPEREDLNTVEYSTIDTALGLLGCLLSESYFTSDDPSEIEIRSHAKAIVERVDWDFMLDRTSKQFFLGWKPNEARLAAPPFLVPDGTGNGFFSGTPTKPQTWDVYTDEAFILTFLYAGATHNIVPAIEVHCAWQRQRDNKGIVRSWPGALFTYQFLHAFLDTRTMIGLRPCPGELRFDPYQNSRAAILGAIDYADSNRARTSYDPDAWGKSAAENWNDAYLAFGVPTLALPEVADDDGTVTYYPMLAAISYGDDLQGRVLSAMRAGFRRGHWDPITGFPDAWHPDVARALGPLPAPLAVEAEAGSGSGTVMFRAGASSNRTVWLHQAEQRTVPLPIPAEANYTVVVTYSNDNFGPLETVTIAIDGNVVGAFSAQDTGDFGQGWAVLVPSSPLGPVRLGPGVHELTITVSGGDGFGIEVDRVGLTASPVQLRTVGPWVNRAKFAIDEGPVVLHLENARSGMIWRLMQHHPTIQRAFERLKDPAPEPDAEAPTIPSNVTATVNSSTQITITWTAATDAVGVSTYVLHRCTGATCTNFTEIATPTSTTYVDANRAANTAYRYRVFARDAAGNVSGASTIVSATTPAAPDVTAPTIPSNVTATVNSSTQITITWTASTDAVGVTGYRLERCQGANCTNFSQIATPTGTSYVDAALLPNTVYRYRVRAGDAAGNPSTYSSTSTATTMGFNLPPTVEAGALTKVQLPQRTVQLRGTATDDGLPNGQLTTTWSGPAGTVFSSATSLTTAVTLPKEGVYTLTLTTSDGTLSATDTVLVVVQTVQTVPMNFSPYRDGQDPGRRSQISEQQIREDLQLLLPYSNTIRIFGMTDGLQRIPCIGKEYGLTVYAGAWLSNDLATNEEQLQSLIQVGQTGCIDLAIAGSETLLRNELSSAQLVAYMARVKAGLPGIPVTTADTYQRLLVNRDVIAQSDIVFANGYPYWESLPLTSAVASVNAWYNQLVAAAPGKQVWISESGFPSCGDTKGAAIPTPANAAAYFLNFVSWTRARNLTATYFAFRDETWKASSPEGPQGACFGLFTTTNVMKPGMERVFNGETVPDNWTGGALVGGPGQPLMEFTSVPAYGTAANLTGRVVHVVPQDYRIATYIKVGGLYWTKPTFASPTVAVNPDGTFVVDITTGAFDTQATVIDAFLVPADYVPPEARGAATVPADVIQKAIARSTVTRTPN
jgi:exo-beta-1,3-glucanase (GH17 family)/fibronectin type 3 domain-containing protein